MVAIIVVAITALALVAVGVAVDRPHVLAARGIGDAGRAGAGGIAAVADGGVAAARGYLYRDAVPGRIADAAAFVILRAALGAVTGARSVAFDAQKTVFVTKLVVVGAEPTGRDVVDDHAGLALIGRTILGGTGVGVGYAGAVLAIGGRGRAFTVVAASLHAHAVCASGRLGRTAAIVLTPQRAEALPGVGPIAGVVVRAVDVVGASEGRGIGVRDIDLATGHNAERRPKNPGSISI